MDLVWFGFITGTCEQKTFKSAINCTSKSNTFAWKIFYTFPHERKGKAPIPFLARFLGNSFQRHTCRAGTANRGLFFLLFHRHRHRWTGVASLFCIVFPSAPRYVPQARIIKKSKGKGREGHAPRQLSSPLAVGVSILQRGLPENGDTLLAPPPGAGAGSKQRIRNLHSGCQVKFNFYCWGFILRQMSCLRDST